MSSSGDTRLHFEGVLEKAGKRFFEVRVNVHITTIINLQS